MKFPDNYFEDEVREGFFITSMMKHCWAAQLQVLEDVDALCQKYNIKYYGDCGTLIGAVRHGGYIPWDDDLDICMLREDYELFLAHAHELPKFYSIMNWRETDDWIDAYSRIINSDSVRFDPEFLEYFHGFPYSAGLDLFVLDYMYEDSEQEEERRERAEMYMDVSNMAQVEVNDECKELIASIEEMCNVKIDLTHDVHKQLRTLAENALTEVKRKDASKVCFMAAWLEYHSCFWDKKYCDQIMRVPFENTTIPIPVAYDEILKAHYGDYMKVNRSGGAHAYPGYSKQEKVLNEKYGIRIWNYQWNKDELTLSNRIRTLIEKIRKIESLIKTSPELYGGMQNQVETLKANLGYVSSDIKCDKDEVVFLTLGPKYWKNFLYFWNKEISNEQNDVYVIPVTYFDTSLHGEVIRTHYEAEGYDVPIVSFKDYDISKRHPKRIYIQCPYDNINPAMRVDSCFYSQELIKYTDELIYVPMFDVREFDSTDAKSAYGLNFTVKTPVLLHADKVYVPTNRLKEEYIKALIDFSNNETDESFWDTRIFVEDYMPDINNDSSNTGKKTLLYYSDVAPIALYGKKSLEKIRSSLQLLKDASDHLNVIWLAAGNMKEVLYSPDCNDGKKLFSQFQNIVHDFKKGGWGHYTETATDIDFDHVDAYAGSPSHYAHILNYNKKPVMILNPYDD